MDGVTFNINNVLEGTRQYFLGVPKPVQGAESSGQPMWPAGIPPEEGAPTLSGAPATSSCPPSAAAAPLTSITAAPPRPPSEPLEPEPHIIHKATVMREAAEKRREQPEPEDDEEPEPDTLSPPSHIIHKPAPSRPEPPSPAPAPAVPSPSPARPPSNAPPPHESGPPPHSASQYPPVHRVQTPTARLPEHFAPGRPPDSYPASRPPDQFARFHYESSLQDNGRNSHGTSSASPQPSVPARHSPQQTYARISNSLPQHIPSRLRESNVVSTSMTQGQHQRYSVPAVQPPPPPNDRVPPIHHPPQRLTTVEARTSPMYSPVHQNREPSPYARLPSHYDRHTAVVPRKYDPQHAYSGYRPVPTNSALQSVQNQRKESHIQYRQESHVNTHYSVRQHERVPVPSQPYIKEPSPTTRPLVEYPTISRTVESRVGYYPTPSTSTAVRYAPSGLTTNIPHSRLPTRTPYVTTAVSKTSYEYQSTTSHVQTTSSSRPATKPGCPSQQTRMTVSVTSLVNQMNQTKQKRESPLDLSVKTVKNSADSSTTQDDIVDSATVEPKSLQSRSVPNSRHITQAPGPYVASLKVDFAPDFTQYRERTNSINIPASPHQSTVRHNGAFEAQRQVAEPQLPESRQVYIERSKYVVPPVRNDCVQRIDLTRQSHDERRAESRIRDDRHFVIEERKRPAGPVLSNIPEKIVRQDSWSIDNRLDHMSRSAREQHELMSRPVYSYSSHKRFEAYQNDQKRSVSSSVYRDHHTLPTHRYSYSTEPPPREVNDYHNHYHDRISSHSRHIIQKIPSHRDSHAHSLDSNGGTPADKRVLSILRNSLETKQTGFVDPRSAKQVPDLIVIDDADDADDSVIVITDLTKDSELEPDPKNNSQTNLPSDILHINHNIQMPKAIDSISKESDDTKRNDKSDVKSKSPENDVASRIRTKAELKVLPPTQDTPMKSDHNENRNTKLLPKSQKQHLFNQIRQDNLRLETVIKIEKPSEICVTEVKSEPMNIDEIEKDAEEPIKTENILESLEPKLTEMIDDQPVVEDMDWAFACDSFMEQLKTGCHKKKSRKKLLDTNEGEFENKIAIPIKQEVIEPICKDSKTLEKDENLKNNVVSDFFLDQPLCNVVEHIEKDTNDIGNASKIVSNIVIKQEPLDNEELQNKELTRQDEDVLEFPAIDNKNEEKNKAEKIKNKDKNRKDKILIKKDKTPIKSKTKTVKKLNTSTTLVNKDKNPIKISKSTDQIKTAIKEESESTDDDEPLINSKLQKEKEKSEQLKYQLLKDLSEKSAYVKLEFCDDVNKTLRKSLDFNKEKDTKLNKNKTPKLPKTKGKTIENKSDKNKDYCTSDSDDDVSVAARLRMRKNIKTEDNKQSTVLKKLENSSSGPKKQENSSTSASSSSTPARKPGFGDGSDFHPGWEEELYRFKRSLRMPSRLIAIPRGRSGGPFVKGSGAFFSRGSTSLPDLDPPSLSPAPSSAPSAATDDLSMIVCARRPDKLNLDSDLESNSSSSAVNKLHYDSEASTSTVFSLTKNKKKSNSIVDVLIQKCGKKDDSKRKSKDKVENKPLKIIPKNLNSTELLPTSSLGLVKNGNKEILSAKKDKLMEDIFYLGAFRKETVTAFRNEFIKNTDGLIGATEEFSPVVLKTRTRTESRVIKQRATLKEVFGDERPASAPPSACRNEDCEEVEEPVKIKKEPELEPKEKPKLKSKNIKDFKDKLKRRSSSIRDGLRSTKSLKMNDAKGRLLRLKKRNNLMKLANKRIKNIKPRQEKSRHPDEKEKPKGESSIEVVEGGRKRRLKRLIGRRKFSSGFDYIRKKKKIIRRDENTTRIRRPAVKPSPESVQDIQKEIKGWFINKSIGETHLHRAARLGYTDCVAYCLEKMDSDPSAKDNAGFTPLHVAAAKGHVRIGRLLLQYGANASAAAQGGIRPLHEACENGHVEMIRLLLAYGADPLLGTYAGQTPEELAEGPAATLLHLHLMDVQGRAVEPWRFPPPASLIEREEMGCDPLSSPPPSSPPPPESTMEIQCTEAPLPPFYSLRAAPGQTTDGLWCLLQDITNLLQIKSKESLLKQIHCGSGSPRELLREIRTQEFLERAQCHQLLCAGEKVNVRASKVALVRVTDKLRQLLKIETILVS